MADTPVRTEQVDFHYTHDSTPNEALLCGFSQYGLAGLTAADYLVDHLGLEQTGHVVVDSLPAITPFENGIPRHHTRFFSKPGLDVTVLVGELFIPYPAADPFARSLLSWLEGNDVDEVAMLSGVPVAHGPDEHRTFYIATEDYRDERLVDAGVPPMGNGFLDGVNAELLGRGIGTELRACVYTTPVHAQVPDVEAAIRLVDAVSGVYDLDVDTGPLKQFATEVAQHYEDLSERMKAHTDEERPEDRMYM